MKCFKFTAVLRRLRKRFQSRTLLEQFLIIFSTILFIVFISLVLALIYNTGTTEKPCNKEVFITEACLRQAGSMLEKMNSSIDPCEDFYEYACGSYRKYSSLAHGKPSHTVEDDFEDEIHRIIRDLISKSNKTGKSSSFQNAHSFYSSCMDGVDGFESIEQRVKMILRESGIEWPKSSQTDDTSRKNIAKSIAYGAYPFYELSARLENEEFVVFQLNKAKTGTKLTFLSESLYEECCNRHYITSARNHEKLLVSTFLLMIERDIHLDKDEDNTKLKSLIAGNLIQLEKDLVNTISTLPCMDDTNTSLPVKNLNGWEIDFLPELGISKHHVGYETSCQKYVNFIESKHKTYTYQFYLVWRFIARFLPFLSTPFRQSYIKLIHEGMNAGLAGNNQIKYFNERWKQCVHLVNNVYGLAIADGYIKDGYFKEEDEEVTSLVDSIREHYHEIFASISPFDSDTFSILATKLEDMAIDLNYPDDNLDNEKLDDYYKELISGEQGFLKRILKKEKIETIRRLNLDSESPKINATSFVDIPPLSNIINLDIETNTLTLPLGLFRFPYYVPKFYKFAKYGGIAAIIAREMYHGLHLGKIMEEKNEESSFDGEYSSHRSCYCKQYNKSETDEDYPKVLEIDRWEEVVLDNIALKVAYELYLKDMEEEEDDPHLPGLDLSSDKLFFLHFAQMHCERRSNTRSPFDNSIPERVRVNNVMMNKKEFSEAFKCKKDARMNPKERCELWK